MADDTMSNNNIDSPDSIVVGNRKELDMNRVVERQTTDSATKPGHIVSDNGESYPDIDQAVQSDNNYVGVAWKHANPNDIPDGFTADSAFKDNTKILVIKPHGGALKIAGYLAPKASTGETSQDVDEGDSLMLSTEAGELDGVADTTQLDSIIVGRVAEQESKTPNSSDADVIFYRY